MTNPRRALAILGAVFGIAELINAPSDDQPLPGIIFGLVVLTGAVWAWLSNGIGAPILLGVLGTIEFLAVLFVYPSAGAALWLLLIFGALSLAVAIASATCLVARTRSKTAPTHAA